MNPNIPVSKIMSTQLVTVVPEAPLYRVKEVLDKHSFHHLPVVESGHKLVGIISDDDFRRFTDRLTKETTGKTWTGKEFTALTAKDIMTTYPISLDPDDTIGLAADIFLANQFHALPVVEDGELLGLVTTHDLLAYCFKSETSDYDEPHSEMYMG
ncbi:MAG: CBS domain-containing protein [Bacteroidetes bacterium]|nr:MAG: CBS domain-containing protein [Bacteroidota bacterium]